METPDTSSVFTATSSAQASPNTGAGQIRLMTHEPRPVHLSSGIRTRGSDQSDIAYVSIASHSGRTLPAWNAVAGKGLTASYKSSLEYVCIDNVPISGQYVRLADLAKLFPIPNSHIARERLHDNLLTTARKCSAIIIQMPTATKNRMVVHAQSSHHENTICIMDASIVDVLTEMKRRRLSDVMGLCNILEEFDDFRHFLRHGWRAVNKAASL
jgi:hypothetical protein